MKKIFKIIFAAASLFFSAAGFAELASSTSKGIAKVIVRRNSVEGRLNGNTFTIERGAWLKQGTVIVTGPRSFAKLLFVDKSSVNIGPKSSMEITNFPKKSSGQAGIITLIKGQVRSKVTKDYVDDKNTSGQKSKLFVKTETAALGVRGTDFQVNFNSDNQITSLITFTGEVAMVKIDENIEVGGLDSNQMETMVSGNEAVVVRRGEYSGVSPRVEEASPPVRISPQQFEALEQNETLQSSPASNAGSAGNQKKFNSVIPPGVDAVAFSSDGQGAETAVSQAVGSEKVEDVKREIVQEKAVAQGQSGASGGGQGNQDIKAPRAGGFVDIETAQYIPPPQGSVFDANTGVYIPPSNLGQIDPQTGRYKSDNYEFTPDGRVVLKEGRDPASVPGQGGAFPPPSPPPSTAGPFDGPGPANFRDVERELGFFDPESDFGFNEDDIANKIEDDVQRDQEQSAQKPTRSTRVRLRFQ